MNPTAKAIVLDGPRHRCKQCRGTGRVPGVRKTTNMGNGMRSQYDSCLECDGVGWIYERRIDPKVAKSSH